MNQTHLKKFKYLYGPVYSWRLGNSLGIDPISEKEKICNFDCIYCQLGKTAKWENVRREFIKTKDIVRELSAFPAMPIDHLTFSGRGEPTLAKNLGEMIYETRKIRKEKIAVITNSSLLFRADVRADLSMADVVVAKLDACNEETLSSVDRTFHKLRFKDIINGLMEFRRSFSGKLALQVMVVAQNKAFVNEIARIAKTINPDEVQLDTPLRPSGTQPLTVSEMKSLIVYFKDLNVINVYDKERKVIEALDAHATVKRHGQYYHS